MARIMDGIKELIKGKEEPEREYGYRTGYDQRRAPESIRYHGYPARAPSEAAGYGYERPYGESLEGYRNGGYDRSEYRSGYGIDEEYRRKSSRHGSSRRRDDDDDSEVIELMVPMCCEKCKEKVEEELGEVEGVESVYADQDNDRVTVTGNDIDTDRCLVKAERAVKKKCELLSNDSDDDEDESKSRHRGHYAREDSSRGGRPSLGRLPSFASGKTVYYDGVGPRGYDYGEKDYRGFRRMPSLRYHEAEYITSFNRRPEPVLDARREYYTVRRMPSFRNHRYHDAEYVNAGDLDYSPRTFYEGNGAPYTTAYDERPMYYSQVSSRLPDGRRSGYADY
jgi:copper chaperone CopZ